jgi:D-glycero-alpha-D-manno-heptose-7-phosphate kinase
MIISRTPVRVSFCGGGTDLAAYYTNSKEGGLVTSVAIQRFIYVTVNPRFDDSIRLSYSQTEMVDQIEDLQHELVREALRLTGVRKGVEITTIADIPGRGTGLGSSSTLTVGLLNALHTYAGHPASPSQLAEEAYWIEHEILGQPCGKQDQYAAACGGINQIAFLPDETVQVTPLEVSAETVERIGREFHLIYTGITRRASDVLGELQRQTKDKMEQLDSMRMQARAARIALEEGDLEQLASLLHEGWILKRSLASGVTQDSIDELYQNLRELGATGGKLLGAGGGGFILFHLPLGLRAKVAREYPQQRVLPLEVARQGSTIIFNDDRGGR